MDQLNQVAAVPAATEAPILAPASPQPPVPAASPQQRIADRLSAVINPAALAPENDLPDSIKELRNDPARRLIPADVLYRGAGVETLFEGTPTSKEDTRAWNEIFADHSASIDEARTMVQLIHEARKSPPDEATVTAWGRTATARIKELYGDKADSMIADGRRLVARDPRVSQLLIDSGLGSHPDVVAMLVSKAASQRASGKLK